MRGNGFDVCNEFSNYEHVMIVNLPGYHSKSIDTCKWVVDNFSNKISENETIKAWVEASNEVLEASQPAK